MILRVLWAAVTVVLAGAGAWLLVLLLPGDAATRILGTHATPERLSTLRAQLGTDRPVLTQLSDWLGGVLRGDLGVSPVSGLPVTDLVLTRTGSSLVLAATAAAVVLSLAVPLGVLAGLRSERPFGRAATSTAVALAAVPDFVVGSLSVGLLAAAWRWLPSLSTIPRGDSPWSRPEALVIPATAMALPLVGWALRYVAAVISAQTRAPHVLAARTAGIPEHLVVLRHLLPAAMAPLLQLLGWSCALLVGSAVVVEQLVQFPGLGSLLVQAVADRDLVLTAAVVLVVAGVVAAALLITDLLAARLDPRLVR